VGSLRFLGWTIVGGVLVLQLVMPWTTVGALARSTPAQLLRLMGDGALDALVPATGAVMLLSLPVAGIILLGTAAVDTRWAQVTRLLVSIVATAVSGTLLWRLTEGQPRLIAPGGWATAAAALCALVASSAPFRPHFRRSPAP